MAAKPAVYILALALVGLVTVPPSHAAAQDRAVVAGRVTLENGAPVTGANVVIPELGVGATSRSDGSYSVALPGSRVIGQLVTITASCPGYAADSVTVTLSGGSLKQDFTLLGDLARPVEVTPRAGTVIDARSAAGQRVTAANETNLVQGLAALSPGLRVVQSAGDPGAGSSVQLRGVRTIRQTTQPLFVVDGMPMNNASFPTTNFNAVDARVTGLAGQDLGGALEGTSTPNRLIDLNPNDVESVEVLQGAAAAAIYGMRGANGVVLITTKHGSAGGARYAFRSSASNDLVARRYPLQRTYGQGELGVTRVAASSWGPAIDGPVYDHSTEAFDTGHRVDGSFSASGGTDRSRIFLSTGYDHTEGVFQGPNNYFNRATVRLNADHHFSDAFVVGANASYADTRGRFTQRGANLNGLLYGLLSSPPSFNNLPWLDPTTRLHRSYMVPDATSNTAGKTRTIDNPFFALNEQVNDQSAARVFGNVFAEYGIASWLTLTSSLGADFASDARLEGCPAECSGSATGGRVIKGSLASYEIDHSLAGTARWSLGDLHGAFTLGQNLNARRVRTLSSVGRGLSAPRSFSILNTLTHDSPSDYETEMHGESYFGQASINFFNQLLLSGALRNDRSTTFGTDAPRQWFPKATAAWQFSEYLGLSTLRTGRVRASYGEAGLEPDPYLTSQAFTASSLLGGVVPGTGLTPTQNGLSGLFTSATRPASALRPERTRELEVGLDLGLGDRLDLSAAWYRARTSDAILVTPIPPSSGFSTEVRNAGVFSNKGIEVSVNLRAVMRTNVSWDVGAGWSRNVSRVESIGGAPYLLTDISLLPSVAQPGNPLGVFLGNGWLRCGLSPNTANPAVDLATWCADQPRGATYIDDGTHCSPAPGMPCGDDLVRVIGDPNPDWTGNAHTTLRVKQLRISGLLDVKYGGDVWNGTKGILYGYGTHRDTENRAACVLVASKVVCSGNERAFGDAGFYPGAVVGPGAGTAVPIGENWYHASGLAACPFTGYDEPCMEDGGYIKLRELSLAYTFDQPWVARALGMASLDVRFAGRNLVTWTKYTGFDPETSLGGVSARIGGQDYFNLPLTRSFVLTIGLNR